MAFSNLRMYYNRKYATILQFSIEIVVFDYWIYNWIIVNKKSVKRNISKYLNIENFESSGSRKESNGRGLG